MSRYRRSIFVSGDRDKNERHITAVLNRYGIPYCLMSPGAGFDILVMMNPMEAWEVKNPEYKWSLTKDEQTCKSYCKDHGIPYRIIETMEQAVEAIAENFKSQRKPLKKSAENLNPQQAEKANER